MHDHRRLGDAGRNLQVPDQRLRLEWQFDDRERRVVITRGLAEESQRMPIGLLLARRARNRVTRDVAILECKRVKLGKLPDAPSLAHASPFAS
jgi:hypothetical protein